MAFLYPRFWESERKSRALRRWLCDEAEKRGIDSSTLYIRFDGDREDPRGPVRALPMLHKRKEFLARDDVSAFLDRIQDDAENPTSLSVAGYSVAIAYNPDAKGPYTGSGGLDPEAPRTVSEHAVYRVLRSKAKQHKVEGPRVICVGSDQSSALSMVQGPMTPRLSEVVETAFSRHRSLSAAFVVSIEDQLGPFQGFRKEARPILYCSGIAREPLREAELLLLQKLDFGRWRFHGRYERWEAGPPASRHLHGNLTWSMSPMSIKATLPVGVVADALAGKTSVAESYGEDNEVAKALEDGWVIISSEVEEGDVQQGEPAMMTLTLVPPVLAPLWPAKES